MHLCQPEPVRLQCKAEHSKTSEPQTHTSSTPSPAQLRADDVQGARRSMPVRHRGPAKLTPAIKLGLTACLFSISILLGVVFLQAGLHRQLLAWHACIYPGI